MRNWMKIAGLVLALLASYYSGHHFGYVDGVIETTADFLSDNPSAVCDLSPSYQSQPRSGRAPSEPF